MPKVGFISLGCPKNLVDSEVMMGILARGGYEITTRADEADVLVYRAGAAGIGAIDS
jgi:ribosomal protein S12 methylthiotransferase